MNDETDTVLILKSTLKTMLKELSDYSRGLDVPLVDGENSVGAIMGQTMLSALEEWSKEK